MTTHVRDGHPGPELLPEPAQPRLQLVVTTVATLLALLWPVGAALNHSLHGTDGGTGLLAFLVVAGGCGAAVCAVSLALQWPAHRRHPSEPTMLLGHRLLAAYAVLAVPTLLVLNALVRASVIENDSRRDQIVLDLVGLLVSVTAVLAISTVSTPSRSWALVGALLVTRIAGAALTDTHDVAGQVHSMTIGVVAQSFIIAAVHFLRSLARSVDDALRASAASVADTASTAAALAEASRIDGLVHDHILAALLLASRADDREDAPVVRRSAAGALAALSEIRAPEALRRAADGLPGDVSVPEFAVALFQQVRAEDSSITCTGRGGQAVPVPADVARTVSDAAMEAVRNSLRHAGGPEVRRTVRIEVDAAHLTVVVADDGAGFDPGSAPAGRYGVRGSIVGRMEGLPGGDADIASTPGGGTTVSLRWRHTADPGHTTGTDGTAGTARDATSAASELPGAAVRDLGGARTLGGDLVRTPAPLAAVGAALGISVIAAMSMARMEPWWINAVCLVAFGAWVVYLLRLWLRDSVGDPSPAAAIGMVVTDIAMLLVTLPAWQGEPGTEARLWTVAVSYFVPVLVSLSNHPVISWIASLGVAATLTSWSLIQYGDLSVLGYGWTVFLVLPLGANWVQRTSLASIDTAARVSHEHSSELDSSSREVAAADARRTRGRRVDTLARPLLERLAAGERSQAPVRMEAALLEANLRDDLRARCFRDTEVTRAAAEARRAGVHVELLDDGGLADATPEMRETVVEAAVRALDGADGGGVVVRVAPPGRDVLATVVSRPLTGRPTRLEIHPGVEMTAGTDSLASSEVR